MGVKERSDRILLLEQQIKNMEQQLEEAFGELRRKSDTVEELIKANADFDNLLVNAEIGALYIHSDMTIRKITPIMSRYTGLKSADTGRPITQVTFIEGYDTFIQDVNECFQSQISLEREVAVDGITWMVRMCPYYAVTGEIDGVLAILFDITKRLEAAKLELETLINNVPGVVTKMRYENGLLIEYANDAAYDMLLLSKEEFRRRFGSHYDYIMFPEDWRRLEEMIRYRKKAGEKIALEYRVTTDGKNVQWRAMQAVILEERDKTPILQCVIMDITSAKNTQMELEKERRKLSTIVTLSGDMIFEYDIRHDYMRYANSSEGILDFQQVTEHYVKNILSNPVYESQDNARRLAKQLRGETPGFEIELRRKDGHGNFCWVSVSGTTLYDKDGNPEYVLGKIHDIDEQKKKERELQEKSQKDSMTGLLNHMTAKSRIAGRLQQMPPDSTSYLIVCDVDDFKKINDTNGHLFGDAVLCSFAEELKALLPEDSIVGRIGGDEFLAFVEDMDREQLAKQLVLLNKSLSDRYDDDRTSLNISCSLGVAASDGEVRDYDVIFQWADSALYKVKSDGKGAYLIVDVNKDMQLPEKSYLGSEENKNAYVRNETLIRNEEELQLFCIELLENVPSITSALKMISERTCRFFGLDDMVCVEHSGDGMNILYQWGAGEKDDYARRMYQKEIYSWSRLFVNADKRGALIFREEQTGRLETELGKSVMLVFPKELKDYQGSIVFNDRHNDRDWVKEQDTLIRISNQIFSRLRALRMEKEEQEKLDRKLNYDSLTNLPVYNRFIVLAEEYLKEHGKQDIYCVYMDFSNFQYLNEVYGYKEGDKVLSAFADALREKWKDWSLFGRVTSDYFVGLIRAESLTAAHDGLLQLTYEFTEHCHEKYDQCNLVIASGLYKIQESDSSVAAMLDNANEARKDCKDQKRFQTTVEIFTEEVKRRTASTKVILANMLTAYNNHEYQAYLQPKISLKTGKIAGAEALVRWIKPDGTCMMPGQFVDILERNGFITKVDFQILEQVMEYLQEAIEQGEEVVPVSVNFSRRHNEFENFVPSIFKRLDAYKVPSSLIEAEITESVFLSDLTSLDANIRRLRERGVKLSVDDFGSGYSSLNVLGRVSVDTIKLDRQFLHNQERNDGTAFTIIKYLIKMLKHLGFQVLAEGVETKEQVEMLKEADCDYVQGYFYARPMPIKEFRVFLREFNGAFHDC